MIITLSGVDSITVRDIDIDDDLGAGRSIKVITSEGIVEIQLLSECHKNLKFKRGRNDD